jgi:acyl carrier protein
LVSTPTQDIEVKIQSIVAEQLGIEDAEIMPSSHFIDDLGADGLDLMEVIMAVEEEFEVEIPESDSHQFAMVQDIVDFLVARVAF